jgi:flagellum-specific peptidoglycan hydrolase FlgJ
MTRADYIRQYQDTAIDSVRGTSLFPSVVMAQAILESSDNKGKAGENKLARYFNNHFGIKAGSDWKGKTVSIMTKEDYGYGLVPAGGLFRIYTNPVNSYIDHTSILYRNPVYRKAGLFSVTTPEEQCDALQAAGYAGKNPNYASTLKALIKSLNLKSIDQRARKKASPVSA